MRCELEKYIDHSSIREQFRTTLLHCPLIERQEVGMSSAGVLCAACHIRVCQLLDAKADLLLRSVVNPEDFRRNPDVIQEHLPEHLKEYYGAIRKRGKTMRDVVSECSRCQAEAIGNKPVHASEKTEMTQCSRQDWR